MIGIDNNMNYIP